MFDWNDLRFFLAVQRAGNLSAAARQLRVNQTTVGRGLEALEASLGRTELILVGFATAAWMQEEDTGALPR